MRTAKINLDIDYIGGEGSLTVEEEKALSDYFKQKKQILKPSSNIYNQRIAKRQRVKV